MRENVISWLHNTNKGDVNSMAKVRSQNRLLIPRDLTHFLKIEEGEVKLYWDNEEKGIYITNEEQEDFLVGIRTLDNKNRVPISRTILGLIGADVSSELVIAVKKKRIYIFKT